MRLHGGYFKKVNFTFDKDNTGGKGKREFVYVIFIYADF